MEAEADLVEVDQVVEEVDLEVVEAQEDLAEEEALVDLIEVVKEENQ
jgi:hypothetical protein